MEIRKNWLPQQTIGDPSALSGGAARRSRDGRGMQNTNANISVMSVPKGMQATNRAKKQRKRLMSIPHSAYASIKKLQ